jgi:hypothetical protein
MADEPAEVLSCQVAAVFNCQYQKITARIARQGAETRPRNMPSFDRVRNLPSFLPVALFTQAGSEAIGGHI